MNNKVNKKSEWVTKGKTIRELIKELETFENRDLEVHISIDSGESYACISLVGKHEVNGKIICGLTNHE